PKDVMRELAAYLIDTGRLRERELVLQDIERQLATRGMVLATVVSARQLSAEARTLLEDLVKTEYGSVTKVALREVIDESVIGGVRLDMPGKQLDATVRTKLEKLVVER
ncbi:MAG: F0F1 ATP synthase subunit delta, partial [Candidatus Saccharimonadales bacterium]